LIFSYLAFERVHLTRYLSGDTNDTASGAETSVTGLEGVWVSSLAEVVGAGVDDDGALVELAFCLILLFLRPLNLEKVAQGYKREMGVWEHGRRELTPMTLSGPMSLISLSVVVPVEFPWASVLKLPRSPTWRSSSVGAPWFLPRGLTGEGVSIMVGWNRSVWFVWSFFLVSLFALPFFNFCFPSIPLDPLSCHTPLLLFFLFSYHRPP
jgi:hypothetical protein